MPKDQLETQVAPNSQVSPDLSDLACQKRQPSVTVDFKTFSKEYSEKWKNLSVSHKDTNCSPTSDKSRDRIQMKNYKAKGDDGRSKKRKKDPDAPKKALSAFFLFCQDERPKVRSEHPDWKVSEIAKELGKRWEHCKTKPKYESQAQVEKARYEKAMAKYKAGKKAKASD